MLVQNQADINRVHLHHPHVILDDVVVVDQCQHHQ
jgi:hypothetical protein